MKLVSAISFRSFFFALTLVASVGVFAQTTAGNSTNGQTYYNAKCDICHGATVGTSSKAIKNAANDGGLITNAINAGMAYGTEDTCDRVGDNLLCTTEINDIAAYIASVVTSPNLVNQAVPHNSAGAIFTIPNMFANTSYGPVTKALFSSGATRGTASFSVQAVTGDVDNIRTTYTPDTGQCGPDTVSFYGANASNVRQTNIRNYTVDIADPVAPNITRSATSDSGTCTITAARATDTNYLQITDTIVVTVMINGVSTNAVFPIRNPAGAHKLTHSLRS